MEKTWRKYPSHQKEYKTIHMRNYRRNMDKETKEIYLQKTRAIYDKHKIEYRIKNKIRMYNNYKKALDSWKGFIPIESTCQMCGKKLFFAGKNKKDSIHFDHRNGSKEIIKISPNHWLRKNPRNLETEKIWLSCNFGILCEECNLRLPTNNREQFVKNVNKYVFPMAL